MPNLIYNFSFLMFLIIGFMRFFGESIEIKILSYFIITDSLFLNNVNPDFINHFNFPIFV